MPARLQRLKDRTVFAVDRQNRAAALGRESIHQAAGHHQCFFVRQSDRFLGLERRPRAP